VAGHCACSYRSFRRARYDYWDSPLDTDHTHRARACFLFGLPRGFALVYTGKVLGCLGSFLLGRTLLFDCCQDAVMRHRLLRAINRAVEQRPMQICLLARVAYFPIFLKNYGFAVLNVPARAFVAALVSVELFNTFEIVFLGAATQTASSSSGSLLRVLPLLIAGGALVALGAYGACVTKRMLLELEAEEGCGESDGRYEPLPPTGKSATRSD